MPIPKDFGDRTLPEDASCSRSDRLHPNLGRAGKTVPRSVPVVLPDDEDRRLDEEPEVAMFEGTSVLVAHQEPDEPLVALVQLLRGLVEGDARSVDDGQVGRKCGIQREEAVVENWDDVL